MNFFGWKIDMEKNFKSYVDIDEHRLAILTKKGDDIYLTLEFDDNGCLAVHPRGNINITFLGDKHLKLTSNYSDDE